MQVVRSMCAELRQVWRDWAHKQPDSTGAFVQRIDSATPLPGQQCGRLRLFVTAVLKVGSIVWPAGLALVGLTAP